MFRSYECLNGWRTATDRHYPTVARFRLLAGHTFNTALGPAYFESNSEIESHAVVGFKCTAIMEALDAEAETLLKAECDRLRAVGITTDHGCIVGFGPISTLPA